MASNWSDKSVIALTQEVAAVGGWRDGVYVPPISASKRVPRRSLVHDIVRALLDLRAA